MKTHHRWEWVTADGTSHTGETPADIYRAICTDGQLASQDEILAFFQAQQNADAGSWKWYDSLIGEKWRFDPNRNDLVKRIGGGRGRRKNPDKVREQAKKNLAVSHDRRRIDHEQAVAIAKKAQAALKAKQTPEQVAARCENMRRALADKKAAMTPEQRAELGRRISEAKKAGAARRKAEQ